MLSRDFRALSAAKAAHQFLTQTPQPAPIAKASPSFHQQVIALKKLIDTVSERAMEQIPGPRKDRNTARDEAALQLRDGTLRALRQVAHVILRSKAGLALGPEFPGLVSVPETSNVEKIILSARSTAQNIAPYQALFAARGIAPDFLSQLTADTNALEALANKARDARAVQLTATRDITRLMREIQDIVRCLTVEIRRQCRRHGAQGMVVYETWQQLKRPHRPAVASETSDPAQTKVSTPITQGVEQQPRVELPMEQSTSEAQSQSEDMPLPLSPVGAPTSPYRRSWLPRRAYRRYVLS